ncbi:MAG: FKBP-type peptidyl-prolyl cis-trans isomerase [Acidimicrobiia bacterium]
MVTSPRSSARVLVGGALLLVLAACGSSGGSKSSGSSSNETAGTGGSTTTTAFTQTAAQKPCVALADPLPAGAPNVPVKVGPAPTTLVIEDLKPGTGDAASPSSTVTVDYIGVACSTGKIFDSSYSRGQTASFPLSGVIPGWSQGLVGMKVGGQRLLGVPSDLAYGPSGQGADIGPNEALWFVVDLKAVS